MEKKLHFEKIATIFINTSFNNTHISICNLNSKMVFGGSCGNLEQLKGSKRGTLFAGQTLAIVLGRLAFLKGIRFVYLKIKGFGNARKSSMQGFLAAGLHILQIKDLSPISHNGCRLVKKKRV